MTIPEPAPMGLMQAVAVQVGACIRPVLQRLTDTMTGETRVIAIPCGTTLAPVCPACAERCRKLRAQQCREGWHLADDPIPPDDDDQDDDDQAVDDECGELDDEEEMGRRHRSTRRREDVPDLPRLPVEARSVGRTFPTPQGKTYRPSTFLTVTLDSYGPVHEDGTPVDPSTYDYQRAALDALHMPKLWDRFMKNLRRADGYQAQYFGCVEPQRRLAPHIGPRSGAASRESSSARSSPRPTCTCGGPTSISPSTPTPLSCRCGHPTTMAPRATSIRTHEHRCLPGAKPSMPSTRTTTPHRPT